jgi:hypothetical protein
MDATSHCPTRRRRRHVLALHLIAIVVVIVCAGVTCNEGHLRGRAEPSPDGRTYLIIDDDNGGHACDVFIVDGAPWPHALHEKGEIAPGEHTIACGGEIGFVVPAGTTFFFNYWGP